MYILGLNINHADTSAAIFKDNNYHINAAGSFAYNGPTILNGICEIVNDKCVALGSGINNTISGIFFDNSSNVYVYGNFTGTVSTKNNPSIPLNNIGIWNIHNQQWYPIQKINDLNYNYISGTPIIKNNIIYLSYYSNNIKYFVKFILSSQTGNGDFEFNNPIYNSQLSNVFVDATNQIYAQINNGAGDLYSYNPITNKFVNIMYNLSGKYQFTGIIVNGKLYISFNNNNNLYLYEYNQQNAILVTDGTTINDIFSEINQNYTYGYYGGSWNRIKML